MKPLSLLLLGSSICLALGGSLLMGSVPLGLTISTYVVILVLLVLTYLVERGNRIAEGIGALMGVLAIVSSSLSQAHLSALLQFGSDLHLSLLDVLMVLGFYVFPATYLVLYARERLRERSGPGKV